MMTRRKTRIGLNLRPSVLSDELILYEILPRLPPKSLSKFKSVCKEWCIFISSDPAFMSAHLLHQSLSTPQVFVYQKLNHNHFDDEDEKNEEREITIQRAEKLLTLSSSTSRNQSVCFPDSSLSYIPSKLSKELKASTNGLLCGLYSKKSEKMVYITNPITRRWTSIPLWTPNPSWNMGSPGLAFDPVNDLSYYVLVFPFSCDVTGRGGVRFKVHSSLEGRWRESDAKIVGTVKGLSKGAKSTYTNGKLYWRLWTTNLIWFDVKDNTSGVLNGPSCAYGEERSFEIGDYNGELSYSRFVKEESKIELWVWRKKAEKEEFEWLKVRCLSLTKIFNDNAETLSDRSYRAMKLRRRDKLNILGSDYYKAKPLCYEGGEIVWFWAKCGMKQNDVGNIFAYNMKTGVLKIMQKLEKQVVFHSYKSCLVQLPSTVLQIDE